MLSLVHRLLAWIVAHPETTAVAAVTFGLVLWKRLPPAQRAAIEARMPRIVNALRVLYALFPDLVKAAYAAAAVVRAPQPPSDGGAGPTAPYRATPAAPPPPPPPPTAARVGLAAIALALALVCGAFLLGCPQLPPVSGCTPQSTRCGPGGQPQACSPTQRWYDQGAACAAVGGVCCRTRSITYAGEIYACTAPDRCLEDTATTDGGTPDAD